MKEILVLMGRTATGKTTVVEQLRKYGVNKIVTYTSRPPRPGELDGIDYHFVDFSYFDEHRDEFIEIKEYTVKNGDKEAVWRYGTKKFKMSNIPQVIILTPSGYRDMIAAGVENLFPVELVVPVEETRKRLLVRGDNPKEVERRIIADEKDFYGIDVTKVSNLSLQKAVEEILTIWR